MALEAETVLESGAFSGTVLAVSAVFLGSLYKWPAFDIKGSEVLTHKPSVAAYRAPVAPQTHLRHRLADGALARALEARSRRVPRAASLAAGRADGEQPAVGEHGRAPRCSSARASIRSWTERATVEAGRAQRASCAAPASRWAAGSAACSRPAPP